VAVQRQILVMSFDSGLREIVLDWARGNEADCLEWMEELERNKIRDMQEMVGRASTWEKLNHKISSALEEKLRMWRGNAPELNDSRLMKRKKDLEKRDYSKRYRECTRFHPLAVENIKNYKNMLGEFVSVPSVIWSPNRKDLNHKSQVLITNGIVRFIDFLKLNFIDGDPKWDGLLMRGISGSGKSIEFAL
jgi:hypothetical protein